MQEYSVGCNGLFCVEDILDKTQIGYLNEFDCGFIKDCTKIYYRKRRITIMKEKVLQELKKGLETAYIKETLYSNLAYKPQFISNNYKEGKKVLTYLVDELSQCDQFQISVAFITYGGLIALLPILKKLEEKNIQGKILTTNYLDFTEPKALEKLHTFSNIELKMYDVHSAREDFHTKGYIFKKQEIYRIIIGSSNITGAALADNREWNTKLISTENGEMAKEIVEEFCDLWNSKYALPYNIFFEEYKERYKIIEQQRKNAKQEKIVSIENFNLVPNSMQVEFISNLKKIITKGEDRALLISATGTGKTYASAFAMRSLGFKRVLFLVHRGYLAEQTKKSYEKVFNKSVSMGLVGSGQFEYDKDFVFATVQTLNKERYLKKYAPDEFECIILDEAHHSSAHTYQRVMNYFNPKLWLGMTATPDRLEDDIKGKNIYEIFNHQIAYEIRLQQAMEEKLLCPFHYFGITDDILLNEKDLKAKRMKIDKFNQLVSDERVRHIIEKAEYYGYSGERVKGLIFCSRVDESMELSRKFNQLGYRTLALNGSATQEERQKAFERLAMEEDAESSIEPLDYILSVDILNEGVDIVEVNQVIMLRPTQSPIIFIQQLGRGLRKAEGKEFVVVLDFIGNYKNNFMIPVALSGDRSYNADAIRKYIISGNSTIPGISTIYFDEIAKNKIFESIDKIGGIKKLIRESYTLLKERLGRVPYLMDFYKNGEIDPVLIIREYKTYQFFLECMEKENYVGKLSNQELLTLEYLSKTILRGMRPDELEILRELIYQGNVSVKAVQKEFEARYGYSLKQSAVSNALLTLEGKFVSKQEEYQKYCQIDIVELDKTQLIKRTGSFIKRLTNREFYRQIEDIIQVGLMKYKERYKDVEQKGAPFVLYKKYSRRDVSFLMNCGKDLSSTMYGMKKIGEDVFIFVTYHKAEGIDGKKYIDGKPDYADMFINNTVFHWDSQLGKGLNSSYMQDVMGAKRKHLLVKKSDAESNFYYMGEFEIIQARESYKQNNRGKMEIITKVEVQMSHPVREDILLYLQSGLEKEKKTL